jgi:hypothetical protein
MTRVTARSTLSHTHAHAHAYSHTMDVNSTIMANKGVAAPIIDTHLHGKTQATARVQEIPTEFDGYETTDDSFWKKFDGISASKYYLKKDKLPVLKSSAACSNSVRGLLKTWNTTGSSDGVNSSDITVVTNITHKFCNECKVSKILSIFGKYSKCKTCLAALSKARRKTQDGFLRCLLYNSKNSSKHRHKTGKLSVNTTHTLTFDQLTNIMVDQNYQCAISGKALNFKPRSAWQASLERRNNNLDYSMTNCCLVALEFNTTSQWNMEKFQHAFTHTETVDNNTLELVAIPRFISAEKYSSVTQWRMIEGFKEFRCNGCSSWKPSSSFGLNKHQNCSQCKKLRSESQKNSWVSILQVLKDNAKNTSKTRTKAGRINMDGSLTMDSMIKMFIAQKGLCAYSGLQLRPKGDWMISLERIETTLGYFADNCCLIVKEMNSTDHSSTGKIGESGSGWSKEKYLELRSEYETRVKI